jgi:hypothetical protein
MKETPILYKTEMVRAILDGRKTKTRRMNGLKEINENPNDWGIARNNMDGYISFCNNKTFEIICIKSPFGQPGDLLWVRETFADLKGMGFSKDDFPNLISYKANCKSESLEIAKEYGVKWKAPIFMPKTACRLWLKITDIRIERLQDITEEDAIEEGVTRDVWIRNGISTNFEPDSGLNYRQGFKILWDSINKKTHSWETNPWVWVVEFERVEKNG